MAITAGTGRRADGDRRVFYEVSDGVSTLTLYDDEGETLASTTVEGYVSHLRWSADDRRVVFTVGKGTSSDGVVQDLYLWDLNEEAPMRITDTGANFGAEWRGTTPRWRG